MDETQILMSDDEAQKYADEIEKNFKQRKLSFFKIPMIRLIDMTDVLELYKGEIQVTAVFKTLLLRRKEVEYNEENTLALQRIYCQMVNKNKDKDEANRFKTWFERLRRLKSFSFESDGLYIYADSYEVKAKIPETESMRINFRQAEKLMKKDVKAFAQLIISLIRSSKMDILEMPVEHLTYYLEGLQRYQLHPIAQRQATIALAYKKENQQFLSEEELQKNIKYSEEVYDRIVRQNQDKEEAQKCVRQFQKLELKRPEQFRDYLYIKGEVLEQFKENMQSPGTAPEK